MSAINATIVGLAHADLSEVHRGFKKILYLYYTFYYEMHVIILDESFQARKDGEDEPYFFDTTPVCPCIGFGTYSQ